MLNYKIRLTEPKGYDEISLEHLYLSRDMSFISGVTNIDSKLVDGQKIMIEFNENNNFLEASVNCKKVTRQGYVIYKQKYHVIAVDDYRGYWNDKGRFIIIDEDVDTIEVDTKYWITDGKLTINNITYDVDIELYRYPYKVNKKTKIEEKIDNSQIKTIDYENYDLIFKYEIDSENPPYITLNTNETLLINSCNRDDWHDVIEFIIKKESDYNLTVDALSCCRKFPYIEYGISNKKKYNNEEIIINGDNIRHYFNFKNNEYEININGESYTLKNDRVTINGNDYIVKYEWRNTPIGETMHLFLENINFSFVPSQKIIVESFSKIKSRIDGYEVNGKLNFLYCGKLYKEEPNISDFTIISGEEYEVFYTKEGWGINDTEKNAEGYAEKYGYIIVDSKPIPIEINGTKFKAPYNGFDGDIKTYKYVIINDKKCLIKTYGRYNYNENGDVVKISDIEYIEVNDIERYVLNIDEVISNSMVRCHPIVGEGGDYNSVCSTIVSNKHLYNFMLFNPLFNEHNVNVESYINESNNFNTLDIIKLYNPSSYIDIPLLFGNNMMNNVLKENIIENLFFKKEKEEAINPIIDMEREIYYPCYNDGNKKSLINEIVFDLHFRSRNLNDWKINEDLYGSNNEEAKNALKPRCNWNIFDYYNWLENNKDKTKPNLLRTDGKGFEWNKTYKYYQPADLLYFLNFTDDDVFYQKSKIGKSFLRLLFFNSDNPQNQTLLYSCTVFMDENKYYKTYMDNMLDNKTTYISVIETENVPISSNTFSVSNDTCYDDKEFEVDFNEEKRLSASFHIKNRYEMNESSEGFYLYIFKEYCEKLHEEPIYLKVEFNHAGEGRTINFILPYKKNDTEYELYNFTNENDLNEFKKGVRLNELYKYMYIPLECVYDEVNKRYCYYMPSGLCKNDDKESVMRFNLYELKIMDESE